MANGDQSFPWFIAHQMPWDLAGLMIAGVFAASMSSLDSSMHSTSTAVTTDFVQRFMGLVSGTVAGLFVLGEFTRRAGRVQAVIGAAASLVVLWYLRYVVFPMVGLLNVAVAIITCFTVGWLASWVIPASPLEVTGLTMYTVGRGQNE